MARDRAASDRCLIRIARFSNHFDSQIAVGHNSDQCPALLVADDRYRTYVFAPHNPGRLTHRVRRQATDWILSHDFPAIHNDVLLVGSIRRRNSLEVIIEDWCIGCGLCAQNCPYGNINLHPFEVMIDDPERAGRKKAVIKQKATSCDLCTHLKEPSCVYACPHDAAHRVDPRTFFAEMLGQGSTK